MLTYRNDQLGNRPFCSEERPQLPRKDWLKDHYWLGKGPSRLVRGNHWLSKGPSCSDERSFQTHLLGRGFFRGDPQKTVVDWTPRGGRGVNGRSSELSRFNWIKSFRDLLLVKKRGKVFSCELVINNLEMKVGKRIGDICYKYRDTDES